MAFKPRGRACVWRDCFEAVDARVFDAGGGGSLSSPSRWRRGRAATTVETRGRRSGTARTPFVQSPRLLRRQRLRLRFQQCRGDGQGRPRLGRRRRRFGGRFRGRHRPLWWRLERARRGVGADLRRVFGRCHWRFECRRHRRGSRGERARAVRCRRPRPEARPSGSVRKSAGLSSMRHSRRALGGAEFLRRIDAIVASPHGRIREVADDRAAASSVPFRRRCVSEAEQPAVEDAEPGREEPVARTRRSRRTRRATLEPAGFRRPGRVPGIDRREIADSPRCAEFDGMFAPVRRFVPQSRRTCPRQFAFGMIRRIDRRRFITGRIGHIASPRGAARGGDQYER